MFKKLASASVVGALVGATLLSGPAPAQAAGRDGLCQTGEFCLYYNSNQRGSISDFTGSIPNYGAGQPSCYDFKGQGNGKGKCVKNNAASVWNRTTSPVTIYSRSGHAGPSQTIPAGARVNLDPTVKNKNASHRIGTARTNLSSALYGGASGGRITTGFDGYRNTPGRHEGIDFARRIDSPVDALVDGQVIAIHRGRDGRDVTSDVSTISIYNATYNRSIIYLHTVPLPKLRVGQRITRGQQIATEGWRGVTRKSSAHTHVEVRVGRKEQAAKSVGDPELTNPNPTPFWNARGYVVK